MQHAQHRPPGPETAVAERQLPPPLKVLLIEDNPLDVRLIGIMLREAAPGAFDLQPAERLADGLQRLSKGDIDIALIDLTLPDSQGFETFTQVQSHARTLPVIVLSGMMDEDMAVRAVHEGAQDYLVKGQVSGPLLVRAMRYAVERKRTSQQLARYAEELRLKNAQLESDFQMAREIQNTFLPQRYPTFPRSATPEQSDLRFHHIYHPAAAVGGDFFNIFPITSTKAGVLICDVMGHGMRAALVTAMLRGLVEELMDIADDPGLFLGEINRTLHTILQRTSAPIMATAAYLIADSAHPEIRFSTAGHPSPYRVNRATGEVSPLKAYDSRHGPAMGLFSGVQFPVCKCPLEEGDLVILFTDGMYEVHNHDGEEYGQERLLAAVEKRITLPTNHLFEELLGDVRRYGCCTEFEDDVCMVGMEFVRRTR